ncbi:MAG TPA: UDP-N-acetylmuramoyl-L-alanine--D-glutamate ligase [Candidatus Paceibacterota bacterium]
MTDVCAPFRGNRITLLGLGLLGRGVGDAEFLASCGAVLTVTDTKTEAQLSEPVSKLKHLPNVTLHLGGHQMDDFTHADLIVKAAGVRLDSPEIAAARAAGVKVAMSTALFAQYAAERGARIVGITGTRGKSTVSHMLYHALTRAGRRAHLGGNVRGLSTLAVLPMVKKDDIAVLELDSWQLQGFRDLGVSPSVAVFTNLMPDHQNYYRDMDEYFDDKANIFRYQKTGDTLIIGRSLEKRVRAARPPVEPIFPEEVAGDWMLKVLGEHNRHNASLAAAALLALGLNVNDIRAGLESFEGVEGRLQFVGEIKGVRVYNDNSATTPEATIAALRALSHEGHRTPVILIMGGSDKGLDMSALIEEIKKTCKGVVLLAGTGTDRIRDSLSVDMIYHITDEAVKAAFEKAKKGDIILFSPAFASFGMFKNEYERNDEFVAILQKYL